MSSGLVDRRNDPAFWTAKARFSKLTTKTKPVCDDCLIAVHEAGGIAPGTGLTRARWARSCDKTRTCLCDFHKGIWADWVPGQMVFGE